MTVTTKTGSDTHTNLINVLAPVGGKSQLAYTAGGFKVTQKNSKKSRKFTTRKLTKNKLTKRTGSSTKA